MEFEVLSGELDRLLAADPFSYSDKESIIALHRLAARFDCVVSKAVSCFDDGKEWASDGAQTSSAWIDTRCHVERAQAKSELRLGRALATMAVVEAAWSKGDISTAQVKRLLRARTPRTEEVFARDEEMLVGEAKKLKFGSFDSLMGYWENHADPDGANEADLAKKERRNVWLTPSATNSWLGHMNLDQVSGAIVSNELVRLEKELFDADWAQAKVQLGREPKLHDLWRTSAQRRADALVEMAIRSGTAPADGRRPRPLFTFLVGYETFQKTISELEGGMVVCPKTMVPWMDVADFERVVFAPGKRVEVSVKSRLFKGATKRAIELRDRQCAHPYCDMPAEQCQIDHIIPWHKDGPTEQGNGQPLCAYHNRLKNGREPPDEPE